MILKAPLTINSFEQLLLKNAQKFPQKQAIITKDPDSHLIQNISYKKLLDLVYQVASFLEAKNIKIGDRLAILMENTAEILLLEFACALLGATTVPLDFKRDTLERKLFKLKETDSKLLFVKLVESSDSSELKSIKRKLPNLQIFSWSSFDEFVKLLPKIKKLNFKPHLDKPYVILYTSGTTAHPRGAVLSQRACLLNASGIGKWQKFDETERFLIVLPLHHINSTIFCLSILLSGGTIILTTRYSASNFWPIISQFKISNTSIVPTILHDLLTRLNEFKSEKVNISSLKRICIGSAPVLPKETFKFYQAFGVRVIQGYGQTETALRVSGVPVDLSKKNYEKMILLNSIGTSLSNNELAIMDSDNNFRKEGEEGEICIKGPILTDGYLDSLGKKDPAFKKGWFHSGDLGYFKNLTGEKYFFIVGRIKEIIIKGGVNISPSAIEDALLKHFPQIDEVSVVGYPDQRMGEEIAAAIVLKKGIKSTNLAAGIVEAGQNEKVDLSRYEAPKKVFIFDKLPKTSTGKLQRTEVKKMVGKLIGKAHESHLYVRQIHPSEINILKEIVKINNERWEGLPASLEEFRKRAKNGLLLAVFEEKGVLGSISCTQLRKAALASLKTWDQVSSYGTLSNNDPKGDTIVCVAISVKSNLKDQPKLKTLSVKNEAKLQQLARKYILEYVVSSKDHVLAFHQKSKGGLRGAKVLKILENGRKEDLQAMGYNVLMKYPAMDKKTKIVYANSPTPAVKLLEQVLSYAKEKGISNVIAFSRPAGFRQYLLKSSIIGGK